MTSQFVPLLRNEITKAVRRKVPYFGIVLAGLICTIVYFVAGQISAAAEANAWGYVAFSMQIVFTDIGPIFITVFSAMLLAEETGSGTIRAALAAPVQRWELYFAKAVAGVGYMTALSATTALVSAAFASVHYRFGAVADAGGLVYEQSHMIGQFLLAYALSWIPLVALVMYGLLISTVIRTSGAAVAVGIGLLFLVEFTKHLVGLDPYIFTRYINYPWLNFSQMAQGMETSWLPEAWKMIALCGVSAGIAFGAGLTIFLKRDLNH